ncbi:unnamed protein product [Gongylonema pulchrum]|uniref:MMS19 nucleotide excision repair protein n=1 Tax=Gongylonema pulchrum TaxID=637853 RepID=A0A183ECI4_9BILA|nr:unnamed protein product [Gongylonema pulchrum]VDN32233.1 unnamed protein product [Gongylonema pulchrum]
MADDMLRPFVPYYSMPSFTKDLPETKKLGIILKHLYFLKREGPDAQEELVKMLKETIEKYSTPHSGFYHDPRLLEVFLIQVTCFDLV